MCAYTERDFSQIDQLAAALNAAGLADFTDSVLGAGQPDADNILRCRPAFGGNPNARLPGMVGLVDGQLAVSDPTWWFDAKLAESNSIVFGERSSFNARRLRYPLWRDSVREGRAAFLATAFGEARSVPGQKSKRQFRFVAQKPFFLAGLVKTIAPGQTVAAIITRDPHPKITPYHDKACPLFLPIDALDAWLQPGINDKVKMILETPPMVPALTVTPVKTYAGAVPTGEPIEIPSD